MNILFTAPHDFLSEAVRTRYDALGTRFLEAWYLDDLDDKHEELAWVTNPGQHFIVDDEVMHRFPRLEVVVAPSTGTNHVDLEACARRKLRTFSLLDDREGLETISASAEFTFLLLLNGLRRMDRGAQVALEGRWRSRDDVLRGRELQGKKVGLVGFGRIGRRLAAYCSAFDCVVAYYDPYVDPRPDGKVARVSSLQALWESSEIVVICCLLTDETRGMIRGSLIERARPGAVIVNTSRGEVINETELREVLERRPDLMFSADVLTGEVQDRHHRSPLMDLVQSGRILVTPHMAGATTESQEKAAAITISFLEKEAARW
jgi:D-3-phosphoglycerate dehydrogenase / 2-oxoglutarate reductase